MKLLTSIKTYLKLYYEPIDVVVLTLLMGVCFALGGWIGLLKGIIAYIIGCILGGLYNWFTK